MSAVNRDKADKALFWGPAVIDDRLGLRKLVRWLHNETGRNATLRELDLLNDHCLDDIGRRRPLDPKTDDLVKRLRAGG
jgi:hypothetical protein